MIAVDWDGQDALDRGQWLCLLDEPLQSVFASSNAPHYGRRQPWPVFNVLRRVRNFCHHASSMAREAGCTDDDLADLQRRGLIDSSGQTAGDGCGPCVCSYFVLCFCDALQRHYGYTD